MKLRSAREGTHQTVTQKHDLVSCPGVEKKCGGPGRFLRVLPSSLGASSLLLAGEIVWLAGQGELAPQDGFCLTWAAEPDVGHGYPTVWILSRALGEGDTGVWGGLDVWTWQLGAAGPSVGGCTGLSFLDRPTASGSAPVRFCVALFASCHIWEITYIHICLFLRLKW